MSMPKKTLRLLVLDDSQNEAERLVSLFRNAGRATRVQRLASGEALAAALEQPWDLLIASPGSHPLSAAQALELLRRQAQDIPLIQLVREEDPQAITAALRLGAADAVPQDQDERLMLVAARELANLAERRARRAAEQALGETQKRCQLLLDSAVDAIAYVHDGMHIYANRAYLSLFGYADSDELAGTPIVDLIASCDQFDFKDFLKHYRHEQGSREFVCSGIKASGEAFKARMLFSPASYDGEPCIQVVIRQETADAGLPDRLRGSGSQDPLTGLHNRSRFLAELDAAAQRLVDAGQRSTLAYLRLDQYAACLAELGISGVDELLGQLAGLLREHLRDGRIARFGDDVFTVLYPASTPQQVSEGLGELVERVAAHLFEVAGRSVQVTLSIGVVALDEPGTRAEEMIDRAHRCADKVPAGGGLHRYDPAAELAAAADRGELAAKVQQALENDGFRLLFQPIISLRGDHQENYEVLLRLPDPGGQDMPAAQFLQAARQAGLACRIDRWVIGQALRLLAEQLSKGHRTRLFVHLSEASLLDESFLPWLDVSVQAARLPANALVLQLREPDALNYLKQAKALIQRLNGLRCRAALSQFGRALNPLGALRHLNIDFVKVDGAFTRDLSRPESQQALKSLLAELHGQGKLSIVPCVESASVLATLWQAGATYIQGHYLQGPSQSMDYDFAAEA